MLQTILVLTTWLRPHRKHLFSIVVQVLQLPSNGNVFTKPFPRNSRGLDHIENTVLLLFSVCMLHALPSNRLEIGLYTTIYFFLV
jgi:hypothetical protein